MHPLRPTRQVRGRTPLRGLFFQRHCALGWPRSFRAASLTPSRQLALFALDKIGLSFKDLQGLTPEEQFQKVADGLSSITDESTRGAVAQKLFGRAGRQLIPMLPDLAALRQEARDLRLVPSDDSVKAAAQVNDAFGRIKRQIGAVVFEVGAALAPAFLDIAKKVSTVMVHVIDWIRENKGLIVTIAKIATIVTAVGAGLVVLGGVLSGLGMIAGGLAAGMAAVGSVLGFLLTPIGLIAGALIGGIAAWVAWTDSGQQAISGLQSVFGQLWDTFTSVFSGITNALMAGDLALAGQIAIAGLELAFHQGFAALNEFTYGWLESLKNAFVTTFAAMTFAVTNWKLLLQIALQSAGVAIVTFTNQVIHFFTVAIPAYLTWFANNWRDIFTDIWNITKTVAGNIWENLKNLWNGIVGLFKGEGFSFEWTPLTEGFKSAIKELPNIAEREMGPLEKQMKARLDELGGELADAWQKEQAGKTAKTPEQRVKDAASTFNTLARAADDLTKAPVASKIDQAKNALADASSGEEIQSNAAKFKGTFSTVAAALAVGGGTAVEQTARNTQEMVKQQKKTNAKLDKPGLVAGNS